uniref:Uncharacterized protein n=1 Tax=Tetranychus urticae TaxID=32264 RepID=T1KMA6_TETUR
MTIQSMSCKPAPTKIEIGGNKYTIDGDRLVWRNQMCDYLCNHGDGGDLCKCDFMPFHPEISE